LVRREGIVPLAVEIVTRDVDRLHLVFSDLDPFGVEIAVDLAAHLEAGFRGRRADELNGDLVTDQRLVGPYMVGSSMRPPEILAWPLRVIYLHGGTRGRHCGLVLGHDRRLEQAPGVQERLRSA
jgi:hypothetical protein